jgi:uncharacterized protein (TIGR03437 family)
VNKDGTIETVAGKSLLIPPETNRALDAVIFPKTVVADPAGGFFIVESTSVEHVDLGGTITQVAGGPKAGFSGDGGPATAALFSGIGGMALDSKGNLYLADSRNNRIRKITRDGIVTTIAGTGANSYSGDDGLALNASFSGPLGVYADAEGRIFVADTGNNAVRVLTPTGQSTVVTAVLDAASEASGPVSPGKIVALYGIGLGPRNLVVNQPSGGTFGTQVGGTLVSFDGIAAPVLYSSASQVAAVVPYGVTAASAHVTVGYQGQTSAPVTVSVAEAAPSIFTVNGSGAGQVAAVNPDGSLNDALHPAPKNGYVSIFATGEGRTSPASIDGSLALGPGYPKPLSPVRAAIGGKDAMVLYAGAAPTLVAGIMQVVVAIPDGIEVGGYVPIVLKVGGAATPAGALWISVAGQ